MNLKTIRLHDAQPNEQTGRPPASLRRRMSTTLGLMRVEWWVRRPKQNHPSRVWLDKASQLQA